MHFSASARKDSLIVMPVTGESGSTGRSRNEIRWQLEVEALRERIRNQAASRSLGMRPQPACLILRNCAQVARRHSIRLEQQGTKLDAMARWEQDYEQCAASVQ